MSQPDAANSRPASVAPFWKSLTGPVLIVLAAVYFYFLAGTIDAPPGPEHLGAAFWPKMILIFLMISCVMKGGEVLRARRKSGSQEAAAGPAEVETLKLGIMIVLILAAVYFMDILGFPLANFLFLVFFMRIAGLRKKIPLLLTSILGTILLLYIFVKVVYLPLPKGDWLFNDLTIFFYRLLRII
jgi:putative tricarboxylic transport membrane protein